MKKEQQQQLNYLLKSVGKISLNSLTNIIGMVPIYGSMFSTILDNVLNLAGEYQTQKENADIQEQIEMVKKVVNENKITEDEVSTIIKKEILDFMKKNEKHSPVYMYGVILYPFEAYGTLDQDVQDEIDIILSEEEDSKDPNIQEFLDTYNGGDLLIKDNDYFLSSECLVINFYEGFKYKREDSKIIDFIYNLNELIGCKVWEEYTIF